ncbi:MAG TPA: zinc ribbon domain-containing protein [Candidatus Aphodovivens avistercoris]|nr:zinc ribbon domain-containing protein [Candidatus Aphodovivens avistercoris]
MFCPKCGKEVPEGAAFCVGCGNPMGGAAPKAAGASPTPHAAGAGCAAAKKRPPVVPLVVAAVAVIVVVTAIATGGFGLLGGSGVSPKGSVEEYTWAELSAISDEIGKASDEDAAVEVAKKYHLVNDDGTLDGSQRKSVTLADGTQTSVQIAGFAHDAKTGGGTAGITFIFADAIAEHEMNSSDTSAGGWEASEMRSWLASEGKALLPQDLQAELVAVDKMTNNVGYTQDASSVTATSDELWLFSYAELAGTPTAEGGWSSSFVSEYGGVMGAEGSQYKLFRDKRVNQYSSNDFLVRYYEGESRDWWERSPGPNSSDLFVLVGSDGGPSHALYAGYSYAVVPGFCI